ncbi:MAG: hypothetical protein FWC03_04215 [Treponema sp.]|nr:hypothetical protein [Treponema sp.]
MKKFLLTIIILLILGGAGFLLGWVQFSVPPGAYGVIYSKTHGIDSKLVRSGEFRWLWYKLIPTNVKISVFRVEPEKYSIIFKSSLPSGDTYAEFSGLNEDFSWEINAEISFSIDPEKLIQVSTEHHIIDQKGLNDYLRDIAQNINILILHTLSSADTDPGRLERILAGDSDAHMEREIALRYPEINGFILIIHSANFPDFILYRHVRSLYEEFLSEQRGYVTSSFGRNAESHIEARIRFDELERYGALLTRYPILLQYLTLEKYGIEDQ